MNAIFFLIIEPNGKKISYSLFPIPYSAVNSRVIPLLAYVTSKRRYRNMGCTRAIRIKRCFWETMDEQTLDRAVFWRLAAIRRLFIFASSVTGTSKCCHWIGRKQRSWCTNLESEISLDFSSLINNPSSSLFHFPLNQSGSAIFELKLYLSFKHIHKRFWNNRQTDSWKICILNVIGL